MSDSLKKARKYLNQCLIPNCTVDLRVSEPGTSVHRIPTTHYREEWVKFLRNVLGKPKFEPIATDVICSRHFPSDAFSQSGTQKRRLLPSILPSRNLPSQRSSTPENSAAVLEFDTLTPLTPLKQDIQPTPGSMTTSCFFCGVEGREGPLDNVSIPCFRGEGWKPPTWHGDGDEDPNRGRLFVFNYVCTALIQRIVNFDLTGQGAIPSALISLRVCDCCCKAFKEIEEHFQIISSILKDLKTSKEISNARMKISNKAALSGNSRNLDTSHSGPMGMEVTPDEGDEVEMKIVPDLIPKEECEDEDPLFFDTQQSPAASIKEEPLEDDGIEQFVFPGCEDDVGEDSFRKSSQSCNIAMNTTKNAQTAEKKQTFCRFCPYKYNKNALSIRTHEKRKHGDKLIYKCDGCEENFSSKEIAEEHASLHRSLIYPVNCGICGKTQNKQHEHKVHILNYHVPREEGGSSPTSTPRKRYWCKKCDIFFTSMDEKNNHVKENHCICDIPGCGKDFANHQSLIVHLLLPSHPQGKEGEEAPVKACEICGKCFISQILLKRHEDFHKLYDGSGRTLICPHCDLPFFPEEEERLKRHLSTMHPKLEGGIPCTVPGCGASFHTCCTLKYHETTKHPELLVHKCSQKGCGAAYSELCYLETHLRTHDPPGFGGSYFCTVTFCKCSKKDYFRTAEALRAHLAAHNGENVAPKASGPCPECGETFSEKSKLRCHRVEVHGIEGLGSFPCTFCPLKFGTQNRLELHQGRDHADEIETTYPCPICQKSFYPKIRLQWHMKTHLPKEEKTKVRFACEYCGKLVENIKNHVDRKHRGDEVNKKVCYFCGKRVYTNSEMVEHLRTHTKERPCICPNFKSCGKDFTQPHCLKNHLKRCGK